MNAVVIQHGNSSKTYNHPHCGVLRNKFHNITQRCYPSNRPSIPTYSRINGDSLVHQFTRTGLICHFIVELNPFSFLPISFPPKSTQLPLPPPTIHNNTKQITIN